jgi:hypothetical protein
MPNANTETVPRANFLIIVFSHILRVSETADLLFTTLALLAAFPPSVSNLSQPMGIREKEREDRSRFARYSTSRYD